MQRIQLNESTNNSSMSLKMITNTKIMFTMCLQYTYRCIRLFKIVILVISQVSRPVSKVGALAYEWQLYELIATRYCQTCHELGTRNLKKLRTHCVVWTGTLIRA